VWADIKQVWAFAAVAAAIWDPAALRTEQLNDQDIGPILEEVQTGQCPEWKDIINCSPTYKSYSAQWKSLAIWNGILECHWESGDGRSKIAQIILSRSRVNDVLAKRHREPSGGHLGVHKTLNKVWQRYYWLQARNDVEMWCRQFDTCAASRSPRIRNRGQMHQCNVGAPFERMAIDVAYPTEWPRKLIPPDRYGLFYQLAGSLSHSQPRGFNRGRSAGYQLLLPLRSTTGAT
jgi:hypothetical protein